MKRPALLAAALTAALALLLASCGASPTTPAATATPAAAAGYAFVVKDAPIAMHVEAAPVLAQLGTPKDTFEAPSCAFQGTERTYIYSGFKVTTYELDGKDHIASVLVLDDTVATPEGVFLGATLDKVTKAYGTGYTQNLGLYTYASGRMTLAFLIENGKVTSIEYAASAS